MPDYVSLTILHSISKPPPEISRSSRNFEFKHQLIKKKRGKSSETWWSRASDWRSKKKQVRRTNPMMRRTNRLERIQTFLFLEFDRRTEEEEDEDFFPIDLKFLSFSDTMELKERNWNYKFNGERSRRRSVQSYNHKQLNKKKSEDDKSLEETPSGIIYFSDVPNTSLKSDKLTDVERDDEGRPPLSKNKNLNLTFFFLIFYRKEIKIYIF